MRLYSILIPCYNFPIGLKKILEKLSKNKIYIKEVLITNNHFNNQINKIYHDYKRILNIKIVKQGNYQNINYINSWNQLIQNASGNYFILNHDDEFFLTNKFLLKLNNKITTSNRPDVIINKLYIESKNGNISSFFPNHFKKIVTKYNLNFILQKNILGPISTFVFKNNYNIKRVKFNSRLKWLVDVDYYYKILKKNKFVFSNLSIMSVYKKNSSTNTKNPKKNEFVENEIINRKNLNEKLLNFLYINIWLIYKLYLKVINK